MTSASPLIRDLRQSEIKDLERCPQRWHWGWNDQLTPNRTNTKLWMGIGVHEALADYYLEGKKRGPHPAETWRKFCEDGGGTDRSVAQPSWDDEEIEWTDAVELGVYLLEQYVEKYQGDQQYSFIATEQTFNMMILTPKEYRQRLRQKHLGRLVGTWDGIYRDEATGEIWLIEHKTSAVGGVPRFIKMLPIDKQTNTYYMSATFILRKEGLIGPNENISGIMFNWLEKHKPKPDDRPVNPEGLRTNKPTKGSYFDALTRLMVDRKEPNDAVGQAIAALNPTKLPKMEDLEALASSAGIEVYGPPSANQPKAPGDYFKREPAFRSNGDLHFIYGEIARTLVQRQNYLDGLTPLTKNPTMDCSWDCNFFNLCQLHSAGEDWEEYAAMAYNTKEDRYADHNNRKKA